jgi:hypothetical protein
MSSCKGNPGSQLLRSERARKSVRALLLVVATLLAATGMVRAATVQRMSLGEVTHEAARIVHATVTAVHSGRDESGLPATWITLSVIRVLKGPPVAQLTIKQYGVAEPLPDGTITRVAGLPRYRVGEEVVLFLHADSRRGFTSPVGFSQGAYRVRRAGVDARVWRDVGSGAPQPLEDFLSEIGRLAAPAQ